MLPVVKTGSPDAYVVRRRRAPAPPEKSKLKLIEDAKAALLIERQLQSSQPPDEPAVVPVEIPKPETAVSPAEEVQPVQTVAVKTSDEIAAERQLRLEQALRGAKGRGEGGQRLRLTQKQQQTVVALAADMLVEAGKDGTGVMIGIFRAAIAAGVDDTHKREGYLTYITVPSWFRPSVLDEMEPARLRLASKRAEAAAAEALANEPITPAVEPETAEEPVTATSESVATEAPDTVAAAPVATDVPPVQVEAPANEWSSVRTLVVSSLASIVTDVLEAALKNIDLSTFFRPPEVNVHQTGTVFDRRTNGNGLHRHDPSPSGADNPKKTRVLVIGPEREQQQRLASEFGRSLDLRFFSKGENKNRLRDISTNVERVVLWTKFLTHDLETIVRHRCPDGWVRAGEGFNSLRSVVSSIAEQSAQALAH